MKQASLRERNPVKPDNLALKGRDFGDAKQKNRGERLQKRYRNPHRGR